MIKVSLLGLLLLLVCSDAICERSAEKSGPCSVTAACKTVSGAEILSDTQGVDFGPYIKQLIEATKQKWFPLIPPIARPPIYEQGRTGIRFKVYPDGKAKELVLEHPSGDVSLDRAAWGGITGASPYQPLPKQFSGPYLELRFSFSYNMQPQH